MTRRDKMAVRDVSASRQGRIEFASRTSYALLRRYLGIDNGRVPAALLGRESSVLTVAKHLEHIYGKLGVRSRTAAAALVHAAAL